MDSRGFIAHQQTMRNIQTINIRYGSDVPVPVTLKVVPVVPVVVNK